ncbi:hypothetical protein T4E_5082 [Trichinella pseudospiralis]|uniref:Uncharacterized protein n=1 Tax=Trichinella pseudospiralis TaxID=6337 RepID=A0A0V0Y5V7_TRIPS|nr:hypothetical protein T4E_5082 [Trichinella pseudospiralis]
MGQKCSASFCTVNVMFNVDKRIATVECRCDRYRLRRHAKKLRQENETKFQRTVGWSRWKSPPLEGRWPVTWHGSVDMVRVDDWIGKVERLDEQRRVKFFTERKNGERIGFQRFSSQRSNCNAKECNYSVLLCLYCLTDRRSVENTLTLKGGTICQPTRVGQGRAHLNRLPQQATNEAERQTQQQQQQQQQQHEVDYNFAAVHIPSYRTSEENTGTVGLRSEGHTAQKSERDSETVLSSVEKLGKLRKTGRPPYPVCTEVARAVLGDQFIVPWTRQPGKADASTATTQGKSKRSAYNGGLNDELHAQNLFVQSAHSLLPLYTTVIITRRTTDRRPLAKSTNHHLTNPDAPSAPLILILIS